MPFSHDEADNTTYDDLPSIPELDDAEDDAGADRRCATCGANLEVSYCAIDCPQHIDHFEAPGHE